MYGPLLTDLYQLTMLQAYFERGMDRSASFEFFVRKLPVQRNFLLTLQGDEPQGTPLLRAVLSAGQRIAAAPSLDAMAHQVEQRTPQAAAPAAPDRV